MHAWDDGQTVVAVIAALLHRAPVPTRYPPSGAAAARCAKTSKLAMMASKHVIATMSARCGLASSGLTGLPGAADRVDLENHAEQGPQARTHSRLSKYLT